MTSEPSNQGRDYAALVASVRTADVFESSDNAAKMAAVVDLMWDAFADKAVSWLGFYVTGENDDELVLGARRDKAACSPIGLHGVCGRSFRENRTMIAADVHALGDDHVVCDPLNLSEIVVPMLGGDGTSWGVLDLDGYEVGAFDERDAEGLWEVLAAAGLSNGKPTTPPLHV